MHKYLSRRIVFVNCFFVSLSDIFKRCFLNKFLEFFKQNLFSIELIFFNISNLFSLSLYTPRIICVLFLDLIVILGFCQFIAWNCVWTISGKLYTTYNIRKMYFKMLLMPRTVEWTYLVVFDFWLAFNFLHQIKAVFFFCFFMVITLSVKSGV